MKHYITKEQSEKLVELGIDTSTADLSYRLCGDTYQLDIIPYKFASFINTPCWSLGALLALITKSENKEVSLSYDVFTKDWSCQYEDYNIEFYYNDAHDYDTLSHHITTSKNPIDAVFEMVVWLKENNCI